MNQILKDVVYTKGTRQQAEFLADLGGMNQEERNMFMMFHSGDSDLFIQTEMDLSRKSFERVQESMRTKLLLAVFECINSVFYQRCIITE